MTSGNHTSVSKLFEQTVLNKVYKDDVYFREVICGKSDATFRGGFYPRRRSCEATRTDGNNYYLDDGGRKERENMDDNQRRENDINWDKWSWWQPRRKTVLFKFFEQSSMHGLKYIAQPRRHLSERIFWAASFLLAVAAAGFLIASVWDRYSDSPVIVTLAPNEEHIHSIPFPAVTICNMNKLSLDTINRLNHRAEKKDNGTLATEGRRGLRYARRVCSNTNTFAEHFGFAKHRGKIPRKHLHHDRNITNETAADDAETRAGMLAFLMKSSTPCDEMVLRCTWGGRAIRCKHELKPFYTVYGVCCTFNSLPRRLFLEDVVGLDPELHGQKREIKKSRWSSHELKEWGKWNYNNGFLLDEKTKYPRSQARPGAPYGLSLLLDPQVNRYFCTNTDSKGFRIGLNSPLESSNVDFGIAIGLDQEHFVDVVPHLTIADPEIQRFHFTKRRCMFQHEMNLDFYKPYSAGNCINECISKILKQKCACVPYNMIRNLTTPICETRGRSKRELERNCTNKVLKNINRNLRSAVYCERCIPLCSQLTYRSKVSSAKLSDSKKLWYDHGTNLRIPPDWAGHQMSVVHIFFGYENFVPHLRRELYGPMDLIANTGNVLCLCLGFSVMSAAEIVFHFVIRPIWAYFRHRRHFSHFKQTNTLASPSIYHSVKGGVENENKDQNGSYKLKFQRNEVASSQHGNGIIQVASIARTNQSNFNDAFQADKNQNQTFGHAYNKKYY